MISLCGVGGTRASRTPRRLAVDSQLPRDLETIKRIILGIPTKMAGRSARRQTPAPALCQLERHALWGETRRSVESRKMSRRAAKNGEKRALSKGARELGREHEKTGSTAENAGKTKRRETNLSA